MPRVLLLAGQGVAAVSVPEDGVVLRPPPPRDVLRDVATATREALRFPLEGPPLEESVRPGGRATIVLELPNLPIPGAPSDPRQLALEAASAELEQIGIPTSAQTLLVAGGLSRRAGPADIALLARPEFRRRFRGRVVVHDAADPELVEVEEGAEGVPLRLNRALVHTDAVVLVSAAESVVHGGPAALLAAAGAETARAAQASSLLETSGSPGWQTALTLERALAAQVPLYGVSLVLNHPQLIGATLRGYPFDDQTPTRLARAPVRWGFSLLPAPVRARVIRSLRRELTAAAVFGGPPAVAHAEALLRAIAAREAVLEEPVDALVLGIPPTTPHLPRELPNPLQAAALGLGLALRMWRDAFPIVEGGTAILLHPFRRRFAHPTQEPYRRFFAASRLGRDPNLLAEAERHAAADPDALAAYREGRTCHPLLPFADWAGCGPALDRLGAVLVAGCRDAVAARQLGFVPTHGVGAALELARGLGSARVGVVLSPPLFPIRVGRR